MNAITDGAVTVLGPKPPRKPRPSELAAKKAKVKKAVKTKVKKAAKPKRKTAAKKAAKTKAKRKTAPTAGPDRSERIDMRVTKTDKARVLAKAKRLRRTVTSVVMEAIEKIK